MMTTWLPTPEFLVMSTHTGLPASVSVATCDALKVYGNNAGYRGKVSLA